MIKRLGGRGHSSNCYLIAGGLVLIDTGLGGGIRGEVAEHVSPESVELIVNTHCHFDHTGGNSLFPEAEIAMHRLAAGAVESGDDSVLAGLFGGEVCSRVDRELEGGESIEVGAQSIDVLHTPGHTSGSISLLFGEALFTGDTLFATGCGRTDLPSGSREEMASSLKLLLSQEYETAYPGHGPPFSKKRADSLIEDILAGF